MMPRPVTFFLDSKRRAHPTVEDAARADLAAVFEFSEFKNWPSACERIAAHLLERRSSIEAIFAAIDAASPPEPEGE